MRTIIPGITGLAAILADCAPLPLAEVRSPFAPCDSARSDLSETRVFSPLFGHPPSVSTLTRPTYADSAGAPPLERPVRRVLVRIRDRYVAQHANAPGNARTRTAGRHPRGRARTVTDAIVHGGVHRGRAHSRPAGDAHLRQPPDRRVSCDLARTDAGRTRRGRVYVHRSGRRKLA